MENSIKVHEFNDKDSYNKWMEELNIETAIIYDNAFKYFSSMCETERVKQIFVDWWNGACVSTKEYKSNFTKEEFREADGIILTAISRGFG